MTDTTQFIQLLTAHQSRLYAYVLSLVLDQNEADDVLQQTNSILWQKASDFEIGTNFVAWSFRIAYYQVLAHRKGKQRDRLIFDEDLLSEISATATQCDESFETRQRLLRVCLAKLSERHRDFVRRRYSTGSSLQSIADDTDTAVNNVKQILFRARAVLTKCVNKNIPENMSS